MKKTFIKSIILASSLVTTFAFANAAAPVDAAAAPAQTQNYYGGQGYASGHGFKPLNTIADIQNAGHYIDDMPVTLTGTLGRQLGYEHYEFSDGTGTITVEIDHDKFWGQQIGQGTTVSIYGEVDFEGYGLMVDVDMVRVAG